MSAVSLSQRPSEPLDLAESPATTKSAPAGGLITNPNVVKLALSHEQTDVYTPVKKGKTKHKHKSPPQEPASAPEAAGPKKTVRPNKPKQTSSRSKRSTSVPATTDSLSGTKHRSKSLPKQSLAALDPAVMASKLHLTPQHTPHTPCELLDPAIVASSLQAHDKDSFLRKKQSNSTRNTPKKSHSPHANSTPPATAFAGSSFYSSPAASTLPKPVFKAKSILQGEPGASLMDEFMKL